MRRRRTAEVLGAACLALVLAAVVGTLALDWTFTEALEAFVVSNVVIGASFGLCGALIAWHRPGLALGWMYALGGIAQLATAAAAPAAQLLADADAPTWLVRLTLTVFSWSWPLNIGVVLPLSLLLLPDGRLPSPRWRPVFLAVAVTSPLFVLEIGSAPQVVDGLPMAYGTLPGYDDLSTLWLSSQIRWALSMLLGVAALSLRYRRGDEPVRRQLLWLLSAVGVLLVAVLPFAFVSGTPVVVLFAIPLLPAAITVGVLRYQLLDIRLVVARGVSYALLSALVLALYAALVVVLSGVASALLVALLALPVRVRLQAAVERLLYGARSDPARVASRVGVRLGTGLVGALEAVRTELRLPYVCVMLGDVEVARAGEPTSTVVIVPLAEGLLLVGLRPGERRLAAPDEKILTMLAGPLSVAAASTRLSQQLQDSREQLVLAREEERRRLRRDLHDGLGPLLTGVALSADAVANLTRTSSSEAARVLVDAVRTDSRTAIAEVRRIVDDLRPPALDELGLVAALEARAAQVTYRADGAALSATVDAPPALPPLPAALEVAAYRIATEALTNAVRHSSARQVVVRLLCDDDLEVEVHDDGTGSAGWTTGVGLSSMRERAAELGGSCEAGPGPTGGVVRVRLPLVAS